MSSPQARVTATVLAAALALAGCTSSTSPPPESTVDTSTAPDITLRAAEVKLPGLPGAADRLHVSCASRTFCEVVDETGLSWTWTGTAFAAPVRYAPKGDLSGLVSCPAAGFCMATENDAAYVLHGTNWAATPKAAWAGSIVGIACAGPRYCVAGPATAAGTDLRAWHGQAWTAAPEVDVYATLSALDCAPDGETCAAAGDAVTVHHGDGWGAAYRPSATVLAVSCAAGPFCMAVLDGKYAVWRGGTWTERSFRHGVQPGGLACASAAFCVGTDRDSLQLWNGTEWQPGPALPSAVQALMFDLAAGNESCPVDGWCLLVASGVSYVVSTST
ncbi:MAG: hypothetical protein V7603_5726 [Micromonosporaceae bacterium]